MKERERGKEEKHPTGIANIPLFVLNLEPKSTKTKDAKTSPTMAQRP
jgi:hypothetical protein